MRKFLETLGSVKKRFFPASQTSAAQAGRPRSRLQRFEQLEQRTLLSITSEGLAALNIDLADSFDDVFGRFPEIRGSEIRVGVIADGYAANDELPTVTASSSGSGTQGTAMLEIIHDIAPQADLWFAPANSEADFESAVNYLSGQDVDVIVAAPWLRSQPWFEDGPAATAAASAAAANGIVFVSAAGDDGEAIHYQGAYSPVTGSSTDGKAGAHNFGDGSDLLVFDIPADGAVNVDLQWSTAWGQSTDSDDLDLYLYKWNGSWGTPVKKSETRINYGQFGDPVESLSYENTLGETVQVAVQVVFTWPGNYPSPNVTLEIFATGDVSPASDAHGGSTAYTVEDRIFGPAAVSSVITVGAANYDTPDSVAPDSSHGPSTVLDGDGPGLTVRESLDGVAIDNVSYSGGTASGTAIAAAHAGGIAALALQMNPNLSPAEIQTALTTTAVDLGSEDYDNASGHGRFDALAALYEANPLALPDLTAESDRGYRNDDNITNTLQGPLEITGQVAPGAAVALYVDGQPFPDIQTTADEDGNYSFTIDPQEGFHAVSVEVTHSSLGDSPVRSPALHLTIDNTPPTNLAVDLDAASDTGADDSDEITNIDSLLFTLAPTDEGSGIYSVLVNGQAATYNTELVRYEATLTLAEGTHQIAATVTDRAGNAAVSENLQVTVDQTAPTAEILPVSPNPRDTDVSSIDIVFSEPVVGLALADLSLTLDGQPIELTGATLQPADNQTYTLSGLDALTADNGTYVLTLMPSAKSELADLAGNQFAATVQETWDRYSLVVYGTPGDDVITVKTDGITHTVKVNDVTYTTTGTIYVDGAGGEDRCYIYDSAGSDAFVGSPTKAMMDWGADGTLDVTVGPGLSVYAYGSAGDTAELTGDDACGNLFRGHVTYSSLRGPSFYHYVQGFGSVTGLAHGTNDNKAILYGGYGNSNLVTSPSEATMNWNGETRATATGFQKVYAYGSTGDTADMQGDTDGSHVFYGYSDGGRLLIGPSFYQYTHGFDSVTVTSGGGTSTNLARLYGGEGPDTLSASPTLAAMHWSDGTIATAIDFERVLARGSAGDTAELTGDDAGNNTFQGYLTHCIMRSPTFYHYVTGFDLVTASVGEDSTNRAFLYDSDGADNFMFNQRCATVSLNPPHGASPVAIAVHQFQRIYAYATLGTGDTADLSGTAPGDLPYSGNDTLYGRGDYACLRDSEGTKYYNYIRYFDFVFANSGDHEDGNDTLQVPTDLSALAYELTLLPPGNSW